jgi:O-antigen ligase
MPKKSVTALFLLLLGVRPFLSAATFPRWDILYSLCLVAAALLILAARISMFKDHPASPFFALFLIALILSLVFSKNRELSFSLFYRYTSAFCVFYCVTALAEKNKQLVLNLFLISAGCVSFYAVQWLLHGLFYTVDYLIKQPIIPRFALEYLGRAQAFIPFLTPTALGGYLILFIPLCFSSLIACDRYPSRRVKTMDAKNMIYLALSFLTTLALLSTQSLGALFSLMAATTIFLLIHKGNFGNKKILYLVIVFSVLFLLLAILRESNPQGFNKPLFSVASRYNYWKQALINICNHPYVGSGLGNYPFFRTISPHNSYLQLWTETGLLGLVAFLGIASLSLAPDFSKIPDKEKIILWGLWIGNLAFLIHNLIDFTLFQPEVSLQWWGVAALLMGRKARTDHRGKLS